MTDQDQLYMAIQGDKCVVTNDRNDRDIPIGARPVPVSRFNANDYVRLKESGISNFVFNQSSQSARAADSAPQGVQGYMQLLLAVFVSIVILAIILGIGDTISGGALLR